MINHNRYSRQIALQEIGAIGQQKLQNAKVLVIGAGGLGCPVMQNLAATGIGTIGIVDGDTVDETNLHRQLLYSLKDCGKSKVKRAKKALSKINPAVKLNIYNAFFKEENAFEIASQYDIIVDCTDSIPVRYLINDVAVSIGIPVVYASIHKFEGQVSVFNYKNGPSYRCLFPKEENENEIPNCVNSGVLGVIPNLIGTFQANEVLKIILEIGDVFSGKLLVVNALNLQIQTIDFTKSDSQIKISKEIGNQIFKNTNQTFIRTINNTEFIKYCEDSNYVIIDVREIHEEPKLQFESIKNIPVSNIDSILKQIPKHQKMVLFCQSGQRSLYALNHLLKEGFEHVYHLENGIKSLQLEQNI